MVDELQGNDGLREKNEITMRAHKRKKNEKRKGRKRRRQRERYKEENIATNCNGLNPTLFSKAVVTTADGELCHTTSNV
jgi:hypothetical protein